uniref:PEP-CTERM sorting domain-containing protein n=1 Tax=Anaerolinea thermolimosa TaxID=229919 RepID=A0A7C4KHQ9_9CHLR
MKTIETRSVSLSGLLATLSLVLFCTLNTHAQGLIWSASHSAGNSAPLASWQVAFDHVSDPSFPIYPSLNPVTGIFSMTIATNDTGRTFAANALNEPGFAGFVAGLTDGENGHLRFQDGSGAVQPWHEQDFLGRSALAPDLAGYNITEIAFRVNNFYDYFDVPEDRWFRTLEYSLDFYGAPVPEPSTYALLALGAAALLMWRKARRPTTETKIGNE